MIYTHTHNKTALFAASGRLIGVLLLCIYIQASVCYPLVRIAKLKSLHETVAQRFQMDRKTVQLVFTQDQVRLVHHKNHKELEYNHRMYDVLSVKNRGNKVIYTCFADEEEDAENGIWRNWKSKHHDNHSHKSKKIGFVSFESLPFAVDVIVATVMELRKLKHRPVTRTRAYPSRNLLPGTHPPESFPFFLA